MKTKKNAERRIEIKKMLTENGYYISPLGLVQKSISDEYVLADIPNSYSRVYDGKWIVLSTGIAQSEFQEQFERERKGLISFLNQEKIGHRNVGEQHYHKD
jgi:hypothetical protein